MAPAAVIAARRWSALYLLAATCYTSAVYMGFGGVFYGVVWVTGSLQPLTLAATLNLWAWSLLSACVGGVLVWSLGGRLAAAAVRWAMTAPLPVPMHEPTHQAVETPVPAAVASAPTPVPARR
jgi:hypothetical protein